MPSRTAEFVTLFRALESRLPADRRLFEDPYAATLLGGRLKAVVALARVPGSGRLVPAAIDRGWPGTRVSVIVRTRFIDEAVAAAGARQVVILGAGFDTRARRLLAGTRVLELDEPETLTLKRERLERVPSNVTFVPVDFEREPLDERLRSAGFAAEPTLFIWEGVTSYLTAAAVDATLRAITRLGTPASRVVFTYLDRAALDHGGLRAAARTVRAVGEPFSFGFDPEKLPEYLQARGLSLIDDVSAVELAERYLHPRGRRPRASAAFRIAVADRVTSDTSARGRPPLRRG
jgi:methyltransferase (TIGR00027 family)